MNRLILGDAIEVLKTLPDNSVDALISDPPAGISFMSKEFDHDRGGMIPWVNWLSEIMSESLRVMKPGAIGLVWSIPRTCGWTQLALELAGFKIIDSIAILNGSGFPKGLDISAAIDKLHGLERESVGQYQRPDKKDRNYKSWNPKEETEVYGDFGIDRSITAPNHPDAVKWDGWKSAQLKPSHESWFIVQKPCEGTIARNILKWGVGGVNIEASRIALDGTENLEAVQNGNSRQLYGTYGNAEQKHTTPTYKPAGRYPANTILVCSPECEGETHARSCPVSILDEQTSETRAAKPRGISKSVTNSNTGKVYKLGLSDKSPEYIGRRIGFEDGGDGKNASRFFKQLPHDPETFETFRYHTKASQRDRSCDGAVENIHPCVKNRSLMRYFCKLITPPGGIVLDPFGGSGSTAIGAIEEGFNYLLIEKEEEYYDVAKKRIDVTIKSSERLMS